MKTFKKDDRVVIVDSASEISSTKDITGIVVRTIGMKVLVTLDRQSYHHTKRTFWYNSSSLNKLEEKNGN